MSRLLCFFIHIRRFLIIFQNMKNILKVAFIYPPGSKCEALRIGVHVSLLYFIRFSLSTPKTFFYSVDGGWGTTFLVFKFLYKNMVYTLENGGYIYIYIYIFVHNKFLVGLILWRSWGVAPKFSKTPSKTEFLKKWSPTWRS